MPVQHGDCTALREYMLWLLFTVNLHFNWLYSLVRGDCSLSWDEFVLPEGEEDVQAFINLH